MRFLPRRSRRTGGADMLRRSFASADAEQAAQPCEQRQGSWNQPKSKATAQASMKRFSLRGSVQQNRFNRHLDIQTCGHLYRERGPELFALQLRQRAEQRDRKARRADRSAANKSSPKNRATTSTSTSAAQRPAQSCRPGKRALRSSFRKRSRPSTPQGRYSEHLQQIECNASAMSEMLADSMVTEANMMQH